MTTWNDLRELEAPPVNTAALHHIDCPWQLDQYPWECTCGATAAKAEIDRLQSIANEFARQSAEAALEIERLRAVLEEFARQKTEDEMSGEEYDNADGWGAYETFIHRAREALK